MIDSTMKSITHSQPVFFARTQSSQISTASKTARIFELKVTEESSPLALQHSDFDSFMAELEADPANAEDLVEAGHWVAETLYGKEGDTVKSARLKKGLSQKQLADIIGSSQPHIANFEKGTQDPHFSTAKKISEALDVSLDALFEMLETQRNLNHAKVSK